MRIPIAILVFANLAFFGWAHWIAPDPVPPPDPLKATVPRLKLAREADAPEAPPAPAPAAAPVSGATRGPVVPALPAALPGGFEAPAAPATAAVQCVTLGPFAASEASGQAAAELRGKGFDTAERPVHSEVADGWWVYLNAVPSAAAERAIVRRLQQNGMDDAQEMPPSAAGLRVSVGVFSERARAERRAAAVSRLGLGPQIGEHTHTLTQYWLDVRVRGAGPGIDPAAVEALARSGANVSTTPCPGAAAMVASDAPPA